MIEDLTIDLLSNYGFPEEALERYKEYSSYESFHVNTPTGIYWASNVDRKIYSGVDGYKKYYFRDESPPAFPKYCLSLFPEYIDLRRLLHLQKQKDIAKDIFLLPEEIKEFYRMEVLSIETIIALKELEYKIGGHQILCKPILDYINILKTSLRWLEKKRDEPIDLAFEVLIPKEIIKLKPSATRVTIDEYFDTIKQRCFDEKEYNQFASLLTDFFEHSPVTLPVKSIKAKHQSKGRIASVMQPLYRELKEAVLKDDIQYLKIIKILSVFSKYDTSFIYNDITR